LSILVTDDVTIRRLNRTYRGKNAATDVLSFAQRQGQAMASASYHLGDVVISIDTARRQAKEYRITLGDEVSHLLVHGVLHLLGYDHERSSDAAAMKAREDTILGRAHHH
jgi:probable rRNA maturation factor